MSANALPIRSTEPPISRPASAIDPALTPLNVFVDLDLNNILDPRAVEVVLVDASQEYLKIPMGSGGTITWRLSGPNTTTATFDNPPITFNGRDGSSLLMPVPNGRKSVTVEWANVTPTQGLSFFYTLRIVVVIGGITIPVTHDPTVHNEPPS